MLIFLLAAVTSLVEPLLKDITDYHYAKIPTNEVIKADVNLLGHYWNYAPRLSSYDRCVVKGANLSLIPCINGRSFTSPNVRVEDMLWLNEAFAERYSCSRERSADGFFPYSVMQARESLNNPIRYQRPLFITKAPSREGYTMVFPYRTGDNYHDMPVFSEENLINYFGGDYADPQNSFFQDSPLKSGSPITLYEIVDRIIPYLNKFSEGVIVPDSGSIEEAELNYTYPIDSYWLSKNVTYANHMPTVHTFETPKKMTNSLSWTSGPTCYSDSTRKKMRFYYLDKWNSNTKVYTELSGGESFLHSQTDESEDITRMNLYITPNFNTNYLCRGGIERMDMSNCAAIHMFTCAFRDYLDTNGDGNYELEVNEEKYVFYCEAQSGGASYMQNINMEYINTENAYESYAFSSKVDSGLMTSVIWNSAFPEYPYGQELELPDPPEKSYADATQAARENGGSVTSFSSRETFYRVSYDGVWATANYMKFRTKGKQEE